MRISLPKISRGFTLIELLIVISILAVLATVALISFRGVQTNSRDTKRKGDLTAIQQALEQYHADNGFYPSSLPSGSLTNCSGNDTPSCSVSRTYLNMIPVGSPAYTYVSIPSGCANPGTYCTNYCLYTSMELSANSYIHNTALCTTGIMGSNNFGLSAP